MENVEHIIDKYYGYKMYIFVFGAIVFLFIILSGLVAYKDDKKYVVDKLLHKAFSAIIIIFIGVLLSLFGLVPEIEYIYCDIIFFVMISGTAILYEIIQSIMLLKIKRPFLEMCKYIQYISFFELFLLAVTKHLDIIEWIVGTLAIGSAEIIFLLFEKLEDKLEEESAKEEDYPNSDLYYTRKKQLEKFITVLEQQKREPYAIMISGEWGTGKSSFVKALEERLENDAFIWIRAGSEKSVSEIMLEISEQIQEILQENNIIIEKDGLIEKYFLAFSGLLEENSLKFFNQITKILGNNKNCDSKEYLNSKLKKLDKTIFLIIDDLDRCSKKYQKRMFEVIRESTELIHCKTIFLVDKAQFLDFDDKYIEKYISYTLDLCKVECDEILEYWIGAIIQDDFVKKMSSVLLKERSVEIVKQMICQLPNNILLTCGNEVSKVTNNIRNKKVEDIEIEKEKIADITKTVYTIKKNITNSRKIKNYLKGIKRDVINLNIEIEECSEEFRKEDWLKAIIEVQFLKNFLPELYADIKMSNDISEFGRRYKGYSVGIILGMKYNFLLLEEKKETILNHIIYNVDVIDFLRVKSEREKYLAELYDNAIIDNVIGYLDYAETYDDFSKIIKICGNQEFNDYKARECFVVTILSVMAKQSKLSPINNVKFLDISKKFIACLKQWKTSKKEKDICISEGNRIIERVIIDNSHVLRNVLMMLFDVNEVENNWGTLGVRDVDEFYIMLKKIDSNLVYKGLEDTTNKLLSIRKYYTSLEEELQKEKYSNTGFDFEKIFSEVDVIFEICLFWNNIKSVLNDENEEDMELVKQYFDLERGYFKKIAFLDVSNLKHALEVLNEFYESNAETYVSDYSRMLLGLAHEMVLICEIKNTWFKDKKEEIGKLLVMAAEKCYMYDKLEDIYASRVIDELRVFVYKFCYCCKKNDNCERGVEVQDNGENESNEIGIIDEIEGIMFKKRADKTEFI